MRIAVLAASIAMLIGPAAQAQLKPFSPPNVLVVEIGGVGPGLPDTFGGEVHTPTLSRVVANGTVYAGIDDVALPPAMIAAALNERGYDTAAFGRWEGTPVGETGPAGPFDRWPTRQGFGSFYGFLAGEASQYHPGLVRDTELVQAPKTPAQGYHLSADLADDAIAWLRRHRWVAPERPFVVYWAPGAGHGPQQVPRPWADAYRGRFDDGWDAYRERVFERAQQAGWLPADARRTPRPPPRDSWDSIPEAERPFQRRLMEVFAGFLEHADAGAGRVLDEIDRLGQGDDTIVIYLWGDDGAASEAQFGAISDMLAPNGIASLPAHHIGALERMGGLGLLGGPKVENRVHAAWSNAAQLGGTRQAMVISLPARIRPDAASRWQLRGDSAPTLYELLGIQPPEAATRVPASPAPQDAAQGITEWSYAEGATRIPEAIAPRVGTLANTVVIHAEVPEAASGVLYALGGIGGGVTCYLDGGTLHYEYNIFEIQRVKIRAQERLAAGKHVIQVETVLGSEKPRAAARVTLSADGRQLATGVVAITAPVMFSVYETFDVGADLGSPVSLDYFDRAPFALQGAIEKLGVRYRPRSP